MSIGLLTPSLAYKPHKYPWAFQYWQLQQQSHWLPEEVPLGEDCKDWAVNLTEPERNLITQIFRFFTQSDIEVADNYMTRYANFFRPVEIQMMLAAFANIECFDHQTELLTSVGWKNIKDICNEDLIAQYNLYSTEITFVKPLKVVNYKYKGKMHLYENQTTNICVTPNHDMITKHPSSGKVDKVKSIQRKLGRNYLYPATGVMFGDDAPSMIDRVLIMIQADGCLRGLCPSGKETWRTVDINLSKYRKVQRAESLLKNAKIDYTLNISSDNIWNITFKIPENININQIKNLGFIDFQKMNSIKASKLLNEIIFWDGTINKSTKQEAYYTTNKQAADTVQALATLSGTRMATIGINKKSGLKAELPNGTTTINTKNCYVVTFVKDRIWKTYPHKKEIDYDGKVYCVSVPTQNLVSRRMNKVAITGNTIHIAAYAYLLETIGIPESEFAAFKEYQVMRDKQSFIQSFDKDCNETDMAIALGTFGGFIEGLQLFASFAMLFNFPRFNKLKGMGQILTWSIRDESLHCEGTIKLYHTLMSEIEPDLEQRHYIEKEILANCDHIIALEEKFIDLAFELGPVQGMTPEDIKSYIRYIADWRLKQLEIPAMYGIQSHPLPWLLELTNGVEHGNFFETRTTEYSKAASKGKWEGEEGVWAGFDKREKH